MYCMNCGESLPEGATICAKCGKVVPRIEDLTDQKQAEEAGGSAQGESARGKSSANSGASTNQTVFAVVQLVVACLGFLPVLEINAPFFGGSYSLFDMFRMIANVGSLSSGSTQTFVVFAMGVVVLLISLWVVAMIVSVLNLVRAFKGQDARCGGFSALIVFAALCVAASFFIDGSISSGANKAFGVSLGSGMVSPSAWVWIMLISSVCGAVAGRYLRAAQQKA